MTEQGRSDKAREQAAKWDTAMLLNQSFLRDRLEWDFGGAAAPDGETAFATEFSCSSPRRLRTELPNCRGNWPNFNRK